jgi:NAD(P)H-dependent flavin oxidoreductase YrpB (nitropropane dioxygenase family)
VYNTLQKNTGSAKKKLKKLSNMRCLKIGWADLVFIVTGGICNETDLDAHILNQSADGVIVGGFFRATENAKFITGNR